MPPTPHLCICLSWSHGSVRFCKLSLGWPLPDLGETSWQVKFQGTNLKCVLQSLSEGLQVPQPQLATLASSLGLTLSKPLPFSVLPLLSSSDFCNHTNFCAIITFGGIQTEGQGKENAMLAELPWVSANACSGAAGILMQPRTHQILICTCRLCATKDSSLLTGS